MSMGERIKYCRTNVGLTQKELAKKINLTPKMVSFYENNERIPPVDILAKLADIFDESTDYLIGISNKSRKSYSNKTNPFTYDTIIQKRLKELIAKYELSDQQLALLCDISVNEVINLVEYGFLPHIDVLIKLLNYFNVSADYLLNRSESNLLIHSSEEKILSTFRKLDEDSKIIILGKMLELEKRLSPVAGGDKYLDERKNAYPSNGTEGERVAGE